MNGLYLTAGSQHVDNHTVLDHARPHGDSRELYKGILDGSSRTVFNGRIVVRPGAQKTDAKQSNRNLLLSSGALAQTRPQLDIFADDVKCTHGATIGRLDEEALLYLRARALPRRQARDLLIGAFAGEVLEHVRLPPLREALEREVTRRLEPGAAGSE
jgi:Fe-S cluster assembly protein SufD